MNNYFYYSNLYCRSDFQSSAGRLEQLMKNSPLIKKQLEKLDMQISEAVVRKYLKGMCNNFSPVSSGYTGNFYKSFRPVLKQTIMHAIHKTKEVSSLTSSLKLCIVQIIPKADKNQKLLMNWRPITLPNTFYNIISGVLASRLKSVLDYLIGLEHNGYVPQRFIGEFTRTTYDIFQYAKEKTSLVIYYSLTLRKPLTVSALRL